MAVLSPKAEAELASFIGQFYADPLGFVLAAYPWGRPTTPDGAPNPLRNKTGPEPWQRDILVAVGEHIKNNVGLASLDLDYLVWRSAVASGHGVGKSALVAWLIQFFMSTRRDTRGVVTASTQFQLEDKTWPELAKWHALLINRHWFTWTATSYYFSAYPEDRQKNYRFVAATVSERNTEAFAGLHNEDGTVVILFDEASGVAPKIWEVAEGALTDGEGFFFAFGNPTRPEGEFADCFDKHSHLYWTRHVDSREVSHTNKNALEDIVRKYGIDSDEVKVRVRGMFPVQALNGFISAEAVAEAMNRELEYDAGAALIMAVDVSGTGGDEFVIGWRQGRDCRSEKMICMQGSFTAPRVIDIVAEQIDRTRPDAVVIEMVGMGAAVAEHLRERGYRVHGVYPGTPPDDPDKKMIYFNKRIYWWAELRDALYNGLCLPDDKQLRDQLVTIQYLMDRLEQKMLLESKRDMKSRGLPSPDRADTLALTFAVRIARRDSSLNRTSHMRRQAEGVDYDPISYSQGASDGWPV